MEEVEREIEKAGYWREKAVSISAQDYSIPRGTPTGFKPIDRFLELAEECSKKAIIAENKRLEIMEAITCLRDPVCRRLMLAHYIDGHDFIRISTDLGYTVQHICRLHRKAIKEFSIPRYIKDVN